MVSEDIRDLRQQLAQANRRIAELQAVFESVGDAIYIGGHDGVTMTNQPGLDQLGLRTTKELYAEVGAVAAAIQTRDAHTDAVLSATEQPFARALLGHKCVGEIRVRHQRTGEDRIVRCSASPVLVDGRVVAAVAINTDITEQSRAEAARRDSEQRQSFLLKFSDALRAVEEPDAIGQLAVRLLADELDVDRCYITAVHLNEDRADILANYTRSQIAPMPASVRLSSMPNAIRQGFVSSLAISDCLTEPGFAEIDKQTFLALNFRALLGVPLRRGEGTMIWGFGAASAQPRTWSPAEVALVEQVAERTWAAMERARAEAALRKSDARFQQFAKASASGLWIRDAETFEMEFMSPAMANIYGLPADALLGDVKRWASMILPEDRDVALAHLEAACRGESVVHEFRIQRPSDHAFRWIRNTDFPLYDDGRIGRVGGIAEDITEAKLADEHQGVLLAELQHRVRNIMAIIRSIAARSAERATCVAEYAEVLGGRLLALARVQALLTRAANVNVDLRSIVVDELSVQAHHEGQYDVDGPDVDISPKAAEVLTLALHELATNALKYGALSVPHGHVAVRWQVVDKSGAPWLSLDWTERGAPDRARPIAEEQPRRGFGSELIEGRIPYELRGSGKLAVMPGGAQCHLEFPLRAGASVLETSAPHRATVFGGVLDVTGERELCDRTILVVEDDFYLATDAARALQGAGADVLGPCSSEETAREQLAARRPDAVLLDINLGPGPTFRIAEQLKDQRIPFVFVTGYDQAVIPAEFDDVERLEKPVQLRRIVSALAKLLAVTSASE